ncbi:MAG: permease-like cell division protein FtsX [Clostridia bacterium]|nr:permease-like cell division protein FtsX [Clostridia bacterium]
MRRSFGYLTKEGFRNIWTNRLMSIASIAVLLSCLIMIGSAFMVLMNIQQVIDDIEDMNVIVVYVQSDVDEAQTKFLGDELKSLQNVASVQFVDKETAFKEQIEAMGTNADYFADAENILPDTYKVTVENMELFDRTSEKIAKLNGVDSIRDNKDVAIALASIRSSVTYISIGIIALLMLVSLFIISNTVRITMFSRRLEISIMKSVGATNGFIRWPFVIEGILLGIISAFISLGVVWGVYEVVKKSIASMLGNIMGIGKSLLDFKDYALLILVAFLAIGVLSGVVGSMVSIRRYLKEQGGVIDEDSEL